MAFFSVITICKNNIEELIRTYHSVIEQQYENYEWIVIDGNSDDGTKEWLAKTPVANWISENDNGIYDAMNKGITNASGDYLIFMNSGDEFAINLVLKNSYLLLNKRNFPSFAYGDSIDIDEKGNEHYRKAKHYSKNWIGMITQHQAMFFHKPSIHSIKYSNEYPLAGDYAFISQILKNIESDKLLYIDQPICRFSMGGLNESARFTALKEDYKIRKEIIQVPLISNFILYCLHYIHTIVKKLSPSSRFFKHNSV